MRVHLDRVARAAALAGVTPVVGGGAAEGQSASGRYALARYHGQAVPADLGPVPTRDGRPTGCRLIVTAGALTLDVEGGRFEYGYEARDSCTGGALGGGTLSGLVAQRGRDLVLQVPRWIGTTPLDTITHRGTWRRGTVTLYPGGPEALDLRPARRAGRPRVAPPSRPPSPGPAGAGPPNAVLQAAP